MTGGDSGDGIWDSQERPHERLTVWRDSMDLVEAVYRISTSFPDLERFTLTSQMRRAAISVPSNIAEGAARRSTREYLRFLSIARGSLAELDTQIKIAERLGYLHSHDNLSALINRVFAKLNALMRSIQSKANT